MTPAQMIVGKTYTVGYRSGPAVREIRATLEDRIEEGTRFEKLVLRRPNASRTSLIPSMFVERVVRHPGKVEAPKGSATVDPQTDPAESGEQEAQVAARAAAEKVPAKPAGEKHLKVVGAKKGAGKKGTAKKATARKSIPAAKPAAMAVKVPKVERNAPSRETALAKAEEALVLMRKAKTPDDFRIAGNAMFRAYHQARRLWKAGDAKAS